jgi:protein involved in polysaccharide export with SLBB domain
MMNISHLKLSRAASTVLFLALWAGVSGFQIPQALAQSAPPDASASQAAQTNNSAELRGLRDAYQNAQPQAAPAKPAAQTPAAAAAPAPAASLVLREGDTIHISFPGAPSLDSTQTIRRDGKITLDLVGEMMAAGLTPSDLEQQLLVKYGDQLVVKQVSVTVQASEFVVYVSGAVLRPGIIISHRPLTPLEAVLEAGLDEPKANMAKVVVIRENSDGKNEKFSLDLKAVMKGKQTQPFNLKPLDKIIVPEKFSLF